MSDTFMDKLIADLVKGASSHTRENGGAGVNIIVSRENRGHEEKLANEDIGHPGLGGLLGPAGAAVGAAPGHRLSAATGSFLGGTAGGALSHHLLAKGLMNLLPAKYEGLAHLLAAAPGAMIGSGIGGHYGAQLKTSSDHGREKRGHEKKRVNEDIGHPGAWGLLGPVGATLGAAPGHRTGAALGSIVGARAGGELSRDLLTGNMIDLLPEKYITLAPTLASMPGSMIGSSIGGHYGAQLKTSSDHGSLAAAKIFGLEKTAFLSSLLSLAGSVAGPALARAGLSRLGVGTSGGLLGKAMMNKGLAGKAFDVGAGILGGNLGASVGNALSGQQQPERPPLSPLGMGVAGLIGNKYILRTRVVPGTVNLGGGNYLLRKGTPYGLLHD